MPIKRRIKSKPNSNIGSLDCYDDTPWTGVMLSDKQPTAGDDTWFPRFEDSEVINYTNSRGNWKAGISNNCIHTQELKRCIPMNGTYYTTSGYVYFMHNWFLDWGTLHKAHDNINRDLYQYDEEFNSRAFEAMKPNLETSLSLSNFIVELTDVKHLFRFFTKWRGLPTKVAEGHLSWQFGIKPFVKDAKILYEILTDHQRFIDEFLARKGTIQTRHYSESEPSTDTQTGWNTFYAAWMKYSFKLKTSSKTTATMVYKFDCPDLEQYSNKLKAVLDMLGLRLTPSVIWEAIPFSFVVDWFFRVQDFLEAYEEPLIRTKVTVLDYCISFKAVYDCERVWSLGADIGGVNRFEHTDIVTNVKYYRRKVLLPDSESTFINSGQYGQNQLALSASLLQVIFGGRRR